MEDKPTADADKLIAEITTWVRRQWAKSRTRSAEVDDVNPTLDDLCNDFERLDPDKARECAKLWGQTGKRGPWLIACLQIHVENADRPPSPLSIYGLDASTVGTSNVVFEDFMVAHERWSKMDPDERPRHFLVPLIEAWLDRPKIGQLCTHANGILGTPWVTRVTALDYRQRKAQLPDLGRRAASQGHLPLLDEPGRKIPILFHVLNELDWYAQQSNYAPWPARVLVEGLMASTRNDRIGATRLEVVEQDGGTPIIGTLAEWCGYTRRQYRVRDVGRPLLRAMRTVNGIEIALPTDDRPWPNCPAFFPLQFEAREGLRWTDRVRLMQTLPRGSQVGPAVDRAILRTLAKKSKYGYFLYLGLCFGWNHVARGGRVPRLSMPEYRTDKAGNFIDHAEQVILDKRSNRPIRNPHRNRRATRTGRRIPNPQGMNLHRVWEPHDLLDAIFPFGLPDNRRKRHMDKAIKAALIIERIGGCTIVRGSTRTPANKHGFPWRIVPPGLD